MGGDNYYLYFVLMMRLGDEGKKIWMRKKRQTEKEWRKTKGISTANNKEKFEF